MNRPPLRACLCALLLFFCLGQSVRSAATSEIYTPKRGSVERKDVMNAIRPLLEARLGPPVEFVVNRLNIYRDWAFVVVDPQRPGGGAINPSDPNYRASPFQDGLHTYALLKHAYGRWNIVDYVIGPTDVFWDGDPLYAQFPPSFMN